MIPVSNDGEKEAAPEEDGAGDLAMAGAEEDTGDENNYEHLWDEEVFRDVEHRDVSTQTEEELDYWAGVWKQYAVVEPAPAANIDLLDVSGDEEVGDVPGDWFHNAHRGNRGERHRGTICWRSRGRTRYLTQDDLGQFLGDPTLLDDTSEDENSFVQYSLD